jgi:hypothetical protein
LLPPTTSRISRTVITTGAFGKDDDDDDVVVRIPYCLVEAVAEMLTRKKQQP